MNKFLKLSIISLFALCSTSAFANDYGSSDLASEAPRSAHTYEIQDGYGTYKGYGKTQFEAQGAASEACVMQKVIAYESRHGVTPDAETADMFFDACINK